MLYTIDFSDIDLMLTNPEVVAPNMISLNKIMDITTGLNASLIT